MRLLDLNEQRRSDLFARNQSARYQQLPNDSILVQLHEHLIFTRENTTRPITLVSTAGVTLIVQLEGEQELQIFLRQLLSHAFIPADYELGEFLFLFL